MSEEEKKEYEELKSLLYTGTISQYGKRKLIDIIEKQQKEIKDLKKPKYIIDLKTNNITILINDCISKDTIREKIKDLEATINEYYNSGIGIPISDEFQYKIDILQELLKEKKREG